MLENDYKYELKYTYKDKVCSVTFNGEITFDKLVSNLQDFLYSCGWSEDTVKRQIKTEDDMWEESDENKEREKQEELENNDNGYGCHGYDVNNGGYNYYGDYNTDC